MPRFPDHPERRPAVISGVSQRISARNAASSVWPARYVRSIIVPRMRFFILHS
jgi:hypothetical protein